MQLDNKDFWYRTTKNKKGHLVRQKVFKKSKDAIFRSTDMSVTNNMTSELNLDDIITKKMIKEKVSTALTYLTPREERVIRMRFAIGCDTEYTLEEVGLQLSVTRERVRSIEAKALRKFKHPMWKELLTLIREVA
tara:strand:- start:596 stop:1000 length:405 start_codon:yes stop_codon:yes gene_type:complete